ncbi:hypothetical protein SAPIO_CDS9519 [Scedosporium apiospermum]|uniref:Uncharacterized protein n=1 Tax=Pseudallescheria apiosperma TaxID=563466 RepID=A0A084FWZ1_PSEDA|nr:uncharacterized protein SAPIO_CDS9519 [Scedosporium apiospermum]KEZ39603.1 hypothetical protein SAPIO_CDS9519 [Scedosporium apiospermum]
MSAQTPTSDNSLEAGLLSTVDEKRALENSTNPPRAPGTQQKNRMTTLRRFLVALTVSVLVSLTIAAQIPVQARGNVNDVAVNDGAAGEQTLAQIISDALGNKFVQIAKRQNNNSTSEPTETPPTSQGPEPTSQEPSQEPTQPPTSNPPPTSQTPEPTTPEPTPSSTDKNPGTSSDEPSSSSLGSTDPIPSSSTLSPSSSSSQVPSSSKRPEPTSSSNKQTTSRSATTNTRTSTLPGGGITVITSTSYYDVVPQPTGDGSGSDPELQNAAPGQNAIAIIPALFGIVAAMAL